MNFTLFSQKGEVVGYVDAPDDAFVKLNTPQGGGYLEGWHDLHTHYIHNGRPTPRPASPISRSGLTLSNVPTGATLTIDGSHYSAQGTVSLNFPLPGTYALRVECFPYLDWTDEVTV